MTRQKRPEQQIDLVVPFPKELIKAPPRGKHGDYVPHHAVNQRLLYELGGFDFELVEIVRGDIPELKTVGETPKTYPGRANAIVGAVCRITATIDGERRVAEEAGSEDNPQMHHDGENLKNATSDALKRCAMRLGVGLHMWAREPADFFLMHWFNQKWPLDERDPGRPFTDDEKEGDSGA